MAVGICEDGMTEMFGSGYCGASGNPAAGIRCPESVSVRVATPCAVHFDYSQWAIALVGPY
jgi:hypothetical protein